MNPTKSTIPSSTTTTNTNNKASKAEFIKVLVPPGGPVGLQLEESEEWGTQIVRFVDGGPSDPGFARASGQIQPGDWIVQVQLLLSAGAKEDDPTTSNTGSSLEVVASANDYESILSLLQQTSPQYMRELTVRSFVTMCFNDLGDASGISRGKEVVGGGNGGGCCWIPLKSVSFESPVSSYKDDKRGVFLKDFASCNPQVIQVNANPQIDPFPRHVVRIHDGLDTGSDADTAEDAVEILSNNNYQDEENEEECRDDLPSLSHLTLWGLEYGGDSGRSPAHSFSHSFLGQIPLVSSTPTTSSCSGIESIVYPRMTLLRADDGNATQRRNIVLEWEETNPCLLSLARRTNATTVEGIAGTHQFLDSGDDDDDARIVPNDSGLVEAAIPDMDDVTTETSTTLQQQVQQHPGEDDSPSIAYPLILVVTRAQEEYGVVGLDEAWKPIPLHSSTCNNTETNKPRSSPLFPPIDVGARIGMDSQVDSVNHWTHVEHPWTVLHPTVREGREELVSFKFDEVRGPNTDSENVHNVLLPMENETDLAGVVVNTEETKTEARRDSVESTTALPTQDQIESAPVVETPADTEFGPTDAMEKPLQKMNQKESGIRIDNPSQEIHLQVQKDELRRDIESSNDNDANFCKGILQHNTSAPTEENQMPTDTSLCVGQFNEEELLADTRGGCDVTGVAGAVTTSTCKEESQTQNNVEYTPPVDDNIAASTVQGDRNTVEKPVADTLTSPDTESIDKSQSDEWLHKAKAKHQLKLARLRVKKQLQKTPQVEGSVRITEKPPAAPRHVQNATHGKGYTESTKGTGQVVVIKQLAETKPILDRTIWFEAGPVGMQLEAHDRFAARIVRFVDGGPQDPGQARQSGQLQPGDYIQSVEVEGKIGNSYSSVMELFQCSWARRKVTCRSAWEEELASLTVESQQVAAVAEAPATQQQSSNKNHLPRSIVQQQQEQEPLSQLEKQRSERLADDWIAHRQVVPDDILGQEIQLLSVYHPEAQQLVEERMEAKFQARVADQVAQSEASRPPDHLTRWNFEDLMLETVAMAAEGVLGCFKNSHTGGSRLRRELERRSDDDDDDVYYEEDSTPLGHGRHAKTD